MDSREINQSGTSPKWPRSQFLSAMLEIRLKEEAFAQVAFEEAISELDLLRARILQVEKGIQEQEQASRKAFLAGQELQGRQLRRNLYQLILERGETLSDLTVQKANLEEKRDAWRHAIRRRKALGVLDVSDGLQVKSRHYPDVDEFSSDSLTIEKNFFSHGEG